MFDPYEFFCGLDNSAKEKCWETIGAHGEDMDDPSIVILNISEESLRSQDFSEAELLEFSSLECWDNFGHILSPEDIESHKVDFTGVSTFIVLLYCAGKYVTSAQGD